jgi:hypothetical protein
MSEGSFTCRQRDDGSLAATKGRLAVSAVVERTAGTSDALGAGVTSPQGSSHIIMHRSGDACGLELVAAHGSAAKARRQKAAEPTSSSNVSPETQTFFLADAIIMFASLRDKS